MSTSSTGVHDILAIIVTIGGVPIPPSGESDFVDHDFPDDASAYVGSDGGSVWSLNPDESADVTITCSPYSDAHAALGALHDVQRSLRSAFVGFAYAYRNTKNGDYCNAAGCIIMKAPKMTASRDAGDVEWKLRLDKGVRGYGTILPSFAASRSIAAG